MREALEEKLTERVMTLENVVAYQKEMTSAAMEQMRRDFQVELEQAKQALREEFEVTGNRDDGGRPLFADDNRARVYGKGERLERQEPELGGGRRGVEP